MPPLVPQSHPDGRRGAIYQGGVPNNAGGGRTPSAIRAALRGGYDERLPRLFDIADGRMTLTIVERCPNCGHEPPEKRVVLKDVIVGADDSLKAMDQMAKYGLGSKQIDVEDVQARLRQTLATITRVLPADHADQLIAQIRPFW